MDEKDRRIVALERELAHAKWRHEAGQQLMAALIPFVRPAPEMFEAFTATLDRLNATTPADLPRIEKEAAHAMLLNQLRKQRE